MEHPLETPPSTETDLLREYLADRDIPCPNCGYSLRGLASATCPECGVALRLPAAYKDTLSEAERMARYLKDHDLICRQCRTNLRGHTSNVCPTCGKTYMLQHLPDAAAVITPRRRRHPLVPTWRFLLMACIILALFVPVVQQGIMWVVEILRRIF